jgi:hypothetical protein
VRVASCTTTERVGSWWGQLYFFFYVPSYHAPPSSALYTINHDSERRAFLCAPL